MKTAPGSPVDKKALVRLRDEYERRARGLKAHGNALDKRITEMEARTLGAVVCDLNDLLAGMEHPSGRRG